MVYAAAYAGTAVFQKGLGFLVFLWMAREFSVELYALFGLLYALHSGIAGIAGAGIMESVIGKLKRFSDHAAPLFSVANKSLMVCATGWSVVVLLGLIATDYLDPATPSTLLIVIASGVLVSFFTQQAYIERLKELHLRALLLGFVPPLMGLAGAVVGVLTTPEPMAFFLGWLVGMGLAALLYAFAIPRGVRNHNAAELSVQNVLADLPPFILIAALAWLGGYGNTYVINAFFSAHDVALFTFAYTISSVMQIVATATNQVWSPRFFRLVHDTSRAEIERQNGKFYLLQGGVLGVCGAAILVAVPLLLPLLGGNLVEYAKLRLELFFLFTGYALSIPWWHTQNYYLAFGHGEQLAKMVMFSTIAGFGVWILTMLACGSIGIYLGFALHMFIRTAVVFLYARKEWRVKILWHGPALCLILMALATGMVTMLFHLS